MPLRSYLLTDYRSSSRLIQSVLLTFVLSLGVAMATPAVQVTNLSPDQQIICAGSGGMKLVTFAADGTALEVQAVHGLDCSLCGASALLPPATWSALGLQTIDLAQPSFDVFQPDNIFVSRPPPARAPPIGS